MRFLDIVEKKKVGLPLSKEEIKFFVDNYVNGTIPDYQASAFLMAIYFQGMNDDEIFDLTSAMIESGSTIDLSGIKGIKVDKHSTGGVGDKTTFVVGSLVASCGLKFAKMSGRGLGHTGGTLDKMESIPGLRTEVSEEDFIKQVNKIGIAVIGQTKSLVPADKKMYALRDVTETVDSIPLIASSIMSKKIAAGTDTILLDVKVGKGAFMKDIQSATLLANKLVTIGKRFGKDTQAEITDMNQPLGFAVGNSLEIIEAAETLKGRGPKDFNTLCMEAAKTILIQGKVCDTREEAAKLLESKIQSGEAFEKFKAFVKEQGGDETYLDDYSKFPVAKYIIPIYSTKTGYVKKINALEIGLYAMKLGAGRETLNDVIDHSAGIVLNKKVSDHVNDGEILCYIHTNKDNYLEIIEGLEQQFVIQNTKPASDSIVKVHIS